ncbi:MAG: response regulator [Geobacteraceae bacterium]|nr:response regulator [Geobacteraceae bacterium]
MPHGKSKILIVDDTPANIQILNETLQHEFKTYFALNGPDALQQSNAIIPDLILLDIMMPGMDGFEVCSLLKEDGALQHIPVIFITALGQADEESQGLRLGAADYITKPFNPELVLLRVRNHIELKNRRDSLEHRTVELEKALAEIRVLRGIIPICAACKKIRDDQGYWQQLEIFIRDHSDAEFSHGICPECAKELYPAHYEKCFRKELKTV